MGLYAHRGHDSRTSLVTDRPHELLTPSPVAPRERGRTRGIGIGRLESPLENVFRHVTPHLDQGFGACLRLFGEGSTLERRILLHDQELRSTVSTDRKVCGSTELTRINACPYTLTTSCHLMICGPVDHLQGPETDPAMPSHARYISLREETPKKAP